MILCNSTLAQMLLGHFSTSVVDRLLMGVKLHPRITGEIGGTVSRAVIAQALNLGLLADLLDRVPNARAYFDELLAASERLDFDHGALRTVALDGMGELPSGHHGVARVLEPLGYAFAELYPLDRLKMTGRSYRHVDFPENLPQFFVSELHVERFSPAFQQATARVTASSTDPLQGEDIVRLERLAQDGSLALDDAIPLLGALMACFQRRHAPPTLADYELLLAESAEMAWIATEGTTFNHATDRVADLDVVVARQRALARPMKDKVETSQSRRVRQTAYRADPVLRPFVGTDGEELMRDVPGSFFEFIQREWLPNSDALDLAFDTGNAQGIFKMTAAKAA